MTTLLLDKDQFVFCSQYAGYLLPVAITTPETMFYFYQTYGFPPELFIEEIERRARELFPLTEKVLCIDSNRWNTAVRKYSYKILIKNT